MARPDASVDGRRVVDRRALKALIQQMSRAFRDSRGGGIMERFEDVSKLLFTKIVDEREAAGRWNGCPAKGDAEYCWRPGDTERVVYERARSVWQRAVSAYPAVFSGPRARFPRDTVAVARIASILQSVNLSDTPNDVKGSVYEELLRNTFEKNENQQYFTPRHIVDFIVRLCSPDATTATCDPASGSGGFLVGALAHVQARGDDGGTFAATVRGADVDERMAWVARINMLMHGGDPRSISCLPGAGSLAPLPRVCSALPPDSFDLVLTNPPFGSDLSDRDALNTFTTGKGRSSRRRGVLFVERCLRLLKPGGRLGIVLDDSVLNLPANDDIRVLIRQEAIVEAVISLPDVTFMPYSTAKSSILLVRRRRSDRETQGRVFMADVENVGARPNGDPLYSDEYDEAGRRVLKSDLPAVLSLYQRFAAGEAVEESVEGTAVFTADITMYAGEADGSRLDVFFYHPARSRAQERLVHARYPLLGLGELVEFVGASVKPDDEFADDTMRWLGLSNIEAFVGRHDVQEMPGSRIKSNAHVFQAGDILFSRLRPKLRKTVLIPDDDEGGICSAELLVLRVRPAFDGRLLKGYLAYVLRSDLVYGQLIYQTTGVGRPRVSIGAVRRLLIPLPPLSIQRELVDDLTAADRRSVALRHDALQQLSRATREMERAYRRIDVELFSQ